MFGAFIISLFALVVSISGSTPTVQLYESRSNTFGGVEGFIQINMGGNVSFVNGSDWDYTDAMVACRELGMRGVADFTSSDASVTIETPAGRRKKRFSFSSFIPTILKGIQCLGSEKSVGSCVLDAVTDVISENFLALPPGTSRSMTVGDVGYVSCLGFYPVRLVGGSGRHEGRVEVFFNNSWGTVCDDYWGFSDAKVVCKQLGYPGALSAQGGAAFGQGSSSEKIWIDDTDCEGNETSVLLCQKGIWGVHNCIHGEDASVICQTMNRCPSLPETANGRMSSYSTDLDTTVTFSCSEGFVLFGSQTLTCRYDGTWNGRAPLCLERNISSTNCPDLPEIASGRVLGYTSTSVGSEVTIECNPGYDAVGHTHLTCTQQGMWNGLPAICILRQQDYCLRLPNVAYGTASSTQTSIGAEVSYTCDDGFIMLGYSTISCARMGYMGQWNGSPPMCLSPKAMQSSALLAGIPPSQSTESSHTNNSNGSNRGHRASIATAVVFSTVGAVVVLALIVLIIAAVLRHRSKRNGRHQLNDLGTPLVNKEEEGFPAQ